MFANECGNEMLAVIIACLHAQREGRAVFCIGRLQAKIVRATSVSDRP